MPQDEKKTGVSLSERFSMLKEGFDRIVKGTAKKKKKKPEKKPVPGGQGSFEARRKANEEMARKEREKKNQR